MTSDSRIENVKVVSDHYDRFANVFGREDGYAARQWSEPAPIMNIGYWARGATTARQAQEAFVQFAAEQVAPLVNQRVLDVGCGLAGPASILARDYGADVDGITIVERQVAWARHFIAAQQLDRSVRVGLGSAMEIPFPDDTFDVIFSLEAAHCFADKPRFLTEARRVLKTGGKLLIIDLTATRNELLFTWQPALKLRLITKHEWENHLLTAGFELKQSTHIGKDIFRGYRRWLLRSAEERRRAIFPQLCPTGSSWTVRRMSAVRAWLTEFALCRSVLPIASKFGLREYSLFLAIKPAGSREVAP